MKIIKLLLICILGMSLLIMACGTKTSGDLPPEPPMPGEAAATGDLAGQVYKTEFAGYGFADPTGVFTISPETVNMNDKININVVNEDFIYKFAYFTGDQDKSVEQLPWVNQIIEGDYTANWIKSSANYNFLLSDIDVVKPGKNYVVAYACSKAGESWACHDGKWMIHEFTALCTANNQCGEGLECSAEGTCEIKKFCGDGECNGDETFGTCKQDCSKCNVDTNCMAGYICFDGLCTELPDEPYICGDGICEVEKGETGENCNLDCKIGGDIDSQKTQQQQTPPDSWDTGKKFTALSPKWGNQIYDKKRLPDSDCILEDDTEFNNEYINNPFIAGDIKIPNQNYPLLDSKNVNTIIDYYCDKTSKKVYTLKYFCNNGIYNLYYKGNGYASACYCTENKQCGGGWTCDIAQGSDSTTGKCVKNPN
ncbi:MAG: hypothetical protein ABIG89_06980 [Candidatus Woesearchaeota archaeon]